MPEQTPAATPPHLPRHAVIKHGAHANYGAGACAMEFADYLGRRARGERVTRTTKLTDSPSCVCPVIRAFLINWNDNLPDDATRTRLLAPLIPLALDTAGDSTLCAQRAWMATDWLVREHAPAWLDLAGLTEHAAALRSVAPVTDHRSCKAAQVKLNAASAAARAAASATAWDAASAAAWDAALAAAWDAASDAARAAASDAASAAALAAARDAASAAASAAAWAAAWAALQPVTEQLQASAQDLVRRMCAVGRQS